jgi:hypothetical protein
MVKLLFAVPPHLLMVRGASELVSLKSSWPQAAKQESAFQASGCPFCAALAEISFHVKKDAVPYRIKKAGKA